MIKAWLSMDSDGNDGQMDIGFSELFQLGTMFPAMFGPWEIHCKRNPNKLSGGKFEIAKVIFWILKSKFAFLSLTLSHEVSFFHCLNGITWYIISPLPSYTDSDHAWSSSNIYKYYILCEILPWSPYITCTTDELCGHL